MKAHCDLSNSGRGQASGAINFLKWKFNPGPIKNYTATPAVSADNNVYVPSSNGFTYSLSGDLGTINWSVNTGSAVNSSPAIGSDGTIYIGTDLGLVFAISESGDIKWQTAPSSMELGSPTIAADGTIYIQSEDGYLYALSGVTGATEWTFNCGSDAVGNGQNSCPAIGSDGTLYIGGSDIVYALNPKTQAVLWSYTIPASASPSPVSSAALGADGTVYVAAMNGFCYALDGSTGALIWSFPTTGACLATPAVGADGTVYIGSGDGYAYALNGSTGDFLWSIELGDGVYSSISIATDNTVYIGSESGHMIAANGATGVVVWDYTFPSSGDFYQPAIGPDGSLYFGCDGGYLISLFAGIYPESVTLNPSTVVGGTSSTGTVTLNGKAPLGGALVTLTSDTTGVKVPTAITIPAGQTSGTFSVTTPYVVAQFKSKISASYRGITASAILTLDVLATSSVTVSPTSVTGGAQATGTVTLNGPAPPAGVVVTTFGNNNAINVPATVTVPGGMTTASFQIETIPVAATQYTTIAANINGASQVTASFDVTPAQFISFTLNPSTVAGGVSSTGTLTLSGLAPTGGFTATFSNSNSAAGIPGSVNIPAGKSSATITVRTVQVPKQTVAIIVATIGTVSHAASLTISPPWVQTLTLTPTTLTGGASSVGKITLSGLAPKGGTVVTLSSNSSSATLPASVTVGFNKSTATFTVRTVAVGMQKVAGITATTGIFPQVASLTVNAPSLVSIALSPPTVTGGANSIGTVMLSSVAPVGGLVVSLSSNQSAATLPSTATVPAGRTSITFAIKTTKVSGKMTATVSATLAAVTKSAQLGISGK